MEDNTTLLLLDDDDINYLIDKDLWNDCEKYHHHYYIVPNWIKDKLEEYWKIQGNDE